MHRKFQQSGVDSGGSFREVAPGGETPGGIDRSDLGQIRVSSFPPSARWYTPNRVGGA
jgi:hypothetical protein